MVFLTGVNQNHSGFEVEASGQFNSKFRLNAAVSYGNWKFDGDANGNYKEYTDTTTNVTNYTYALDGLYVGDQPQASLVLAPTYMPTDGLKIQVIYGFYILVLPLT